MKLFRELSLKKDGAYYAPAAALGSLQDIVSSLDNVNSAPAGVRLASNRELANLCSSSNALGKIVAAQVGNDFFPVRVILFNKTKANNWPLGWHQDRTICVTKKIELDGFGPWTIKSGLHHVEPPFEYLDRMVTIRVNIDDVSSDNAPLKIALGSHNLGRIPQSQISQTVANLEKVECTGRKGDLWLYSTPIIHCSDKALAPSNRRVLQIDFSSDPLPGDLEWMGI